MTTRAVLSFGHIGLNVTDLERSLPFYRDVFQLDLLKEAEHGASRFAFLGHDGRVMLTLWQQSSGAFCGDCAGLHHFAFEVPDAEALSRAAQALAGYGARVHHGGPVAHAEGAESGGLFFEDPDGIRLELTVRSGMAGAAAPYGSGPTCGFF